MSALYVQVAIDTPVDAVFDYRHVLMPDSVCPEVGHIVIVPFGRREVAGMVMATGHQTQVPKDKIRDVIAVHGQLAPLSQPWRDLCRFAAEYYQRPIGEVALPSLPKNLRLSKTVALDRALKKCAKLPVSSVAATVEEPLLNAEQEQAVAVVHQSQGFQAFLLHGITGSGKTEVYMRAVRSLLLDAQAQGHPAQVLILVPEINLTPQFERNIRKRFPGTQIATLHSGMAEGERTVNWLAAHQGQAQIVLGTRLAILSSMPHLQMIIVDEEHDASYKQQEGLRYSARDLAVWRAHQLGIPVVLGSATPSLESWHHARTGRYQLLTLKQRAVAQVTLPSMHVVDMEQDKPVDGLTPTLVRALRERLERKEQSLLFLNRRGYAPVLHCDACGWISNCPRCTSYMVLHKPEHRLRCHHCSLELRIPVACPDCGNIDLQPLGRGTQRIEEGLQALFPQARLLRIDADSTRRKGQAEAAFDSVHNGEVDILIGTQMVAKGHDFKNLSLVGILNPDTALFSHDYRAGERLFAQLMQVAGRAGRHEGVVQSDVLIQTRYPRHPLYQALLASDYDGYANGLLEERRQAVLPPFMYQVLLRAEARELEKAMAFLTQAGQLIQIEGIVVNDAVPMTVTRVANIERAQLLVECPVRAQLQASLHAWNQQLRQIRTSVKWSLEVDPLMI